ncbi:ankyrin-like protein [Phytophthora cinnamomi]|uniref:ankyrin-like protein n=1 Tax=Phytophthora cinnamomi TaxID=4785 RepID=UPI00355AC42C|nr:ankyrin-like protein [Phytophthora cinnamomi]
MALMQNWSDGREDPLGDTSSALLAASAAGDEARVAVLLEQGVVEDELLANRFFGETPCEQALEHGHVGVAELLVSAVLSRPQWAEQVSELFWRRLLSAALRSRQLSVLGFVLGFEPDLNADVRHSEKPLFDAARTDEAEMLKVLLAHGADASGRDPVGSSVLHIAAKYGAMSVLEVLRSSSVREEVNAADSLGNTALHYAADCTQLDVARVLIAMGADVNLANRRMATPLHTAVSKAKLAMAKLLLEEGQADVNATDFQDNTALLLLAAMTSSDMDEYISDSEEDEEESVQLQMARLLLEHGADVNAANTATATPLHHAMRRYDLELMDVLLAHGADVNLRNRFGDTPLHQAARLALFPIMWQKLLEHGADLTAEDRGGKTPMELVPNNVLRASVAEVVASLTDKEKQK